MRIIRAKGKIFGMALICLLVGSMLGSFDVAAAAGGENSKSGKGNTATVQLHDINSGLTSPSGAFRWLNVADQAYSVAYQTTYNYIQATVLATYNKRGTILQGTLSGSNLKPNFAYQLKLVGDPADPNANEHVGLAGRWWQEEWV